MMTRSHSVPAEAHAPKQTRSRRSRTGRKRSRMLRQGLAAATCALLGSAVSAEEQSLEVASLFYDEQDRVSAVEPVVRYRRVGDNEHTLDLKLTLDTLTGASHNGAMTTYAGVQTFTSPSGAAVYNVMPGEVPLDDAFKDTRVALNGQYSLPLNRLTRLSMGLNYSNEYDFRSMAVNAGLTRDFNDKNTTLGIALSHESDQIDPVGGVPFALNSQAAFVRNGSSESRKVNDILLSWTQVMNPRWLMQLNYSNTRSSGYHTDPYKVVSVALGPQTLPVDQMFEKRPSSRSRHALYWENRYHFARDVVAGSVRYTTDDWGLDSWTGELRYTRKLGGSWYLEPNLRVYRQTQVDFWKEYVTPMARPLLTEVSADYRLGDLDTRTVGLELGQRNVLGHSWSARIESYQQSGDTDAAELDAVMMRVGYKFSW